MKEKRVEISITYELIESTDGFSYRIFLDGKTGRVRQSCTRKNVLHCSTTTGSGEILTTDGETVTCEILLCIDILNNNKFSQSFPQHVDTTTVLQSQSHV